MLYQTNCMCYKWHSTRRKIRYLAQEYDRMANEVKCLEIVGEYLLVLKSLSGMLIEYVRKIVVGPRLCLRSV